MEQHRGTLTCHSTLGEGAVFTLMLPMASAREAVPVADGARTQTFVGGAGDSGVATVE
ncbi:hypothetical protein [Kocuria rosea]|uniref:hypothetical protein n=1 Tax=Kocuria rosea TaxID=1275 RepID=UPI003341EB9D